MNSIILFPFHFETALPYILFLIWIGTGTMDHLFSRYKTNNFIIRITNIHLSQASLRILAQNTKLVANILGKDYESLEKSHHNEETNRNLFHRKNLHDLPEWFTYRSSTKSNLSITIKLC